MTKAHSHFSTNARMALNRLMSHFHAPLSVRVEKNKAIEDRLNAAQRQELRQLEADLAGLESIEFSVQVALDEQENLIERQSVTISQLQEEVKNLKKMQKNHGQ